MVLTTVVCYILCWMPYGVVAMMATFGRPGIITPVAAVVPSLLAKSSTVINPIIYILMNKQVRQQGGVCGGGGGGCSVYWMVLVSVCACVCVFCR